MKATLFALRDGRSLRLGEVVTVAGHTYARPVGTGQTGTGPMARRPGYRHAAAVVVEYLGYRDLGDGSLSSHGYYLCECDCGNRGGVQRQRVGQRSIWRGHFTACQEKERECAWCGTVAEERFRDGYKAICMACHRIAARLGRFRCGKPKRIRVLVDVPNEHLCGWCELWPRAKRRRA